MVNECEQSRADAADRVNIVRETDAASHISSDVLGHHLSAPLFNNGYFPQIRCLLR
jgi:hypothetical protein